MSGFGGGSNFYRGGGVSGGAGGGNPYRGGPKSGRPYQKQHPKPAGGAGQGAQPAPVIDICRFFAKNGNCGRGDQCRFVHGAIMVAFTIPAHQSPVRTLGVMNTGGAPMILSGSDDSTVKIWTLETNPPSERYSIPASGKVTHLEVVESTFMWSVEEPVAQEQPDLTVGTVYLCNTSDMSSIPVHRSEEMPYTHPFGGIRDFKIALRDGVKYVLSSGGEGIIRTWRFDPATNKFEQIGFLEGHLRSITCLLLQDTCLWSGSTDGTIRVWDLGSNRCLGVLSSFNQGPGHTSAVSSLAFLPSVGAQNEPCVASGGADNEVKIWRTNGQHLFSFTNTTCVTALCAFQDELGGVPVLLVGLADGSISCRSCVTFDLFFQLDCNIANTKTIWAITSLGKSCFSTGDEQGQIVTWKVDKALTQ